MARQCELRGTESLDVVAILTTVLVRSTHELSPVNVLVAVHTLGLGDLEDGGFAPRKMALITAHHCVPPLKRIGCGRVRFHVESRRLEAVHVVARCAFSSIGPCEELFVMGVRMTIRAFRISHWRLEIAMGVTVAACHGAMLSQ